MKKIINLMFVAALMCGATFLSSCDDVLSVFDNPAPGDPWAEQATFEYYLDVTTDGDEISLTFVDPINTKIVDVKEPDSWIRVKNYEVKEFDDTYDEFSDQKILAKGRNYLIINLEIDAIDFEKVPTGEREAVLKVKTEDDRIIDVKFRQGHPYDDTYYFPEYATNEGPIVVLIETNRGGEAKPITYNEEQKEFIANWENVNEAKIFYKPAKTRSIPLPWNKTNSQIAFPTSIAMDVKKADGWEMAFTSLGFDNPGRNYFGLYNKELGILRIFYYCDKDVTGTGNHFYFHVQLGDKKNRESFYGTLPYGVPMSHHSTKTSINTDEKVYTQAMTPYHILNDKTLAPDSWNCFDIDMSSYTENSFTKNKEDRIIMRPYFIEKSGVSLESTMEAKIDGTLGPIVKQVPRQGMANRGFVANLEEFVKFGKDGSAAVKDVAAVVGQAWSGNVLGAAAGVGDAITSVKAAFTTASETFAQNDWVQTVEEGDLKGSLDLTLKGSIDTKGFITTSGKPSAIPVYHITSAMIQPDTHLGEGVWNLEEDPELLVASDMVYSMFEGGSEFVPYDFRKGFAKAAGQKWAFSVLEDEWNYWNKRIGLKPYRRVKDNPEWQEDVRNQLADEKNLMESNYAYERDILNQFRNGVLFWTQSGNGNLSLPPHVPVMLNPASVKVVINDDIFPNPTDIEVNAYYGFFADDENLNIPQWRDALDLECYIDETKQPAVADKPVIITKSYTDFKRTDGSTMEDGGTWGKSTDNPLISYRAFPLKAAGKEFRWNPWLSATHKTNTYNAIGIDFYNYVFFNGSINRSATQNGYWDSFMSHSYFNSINCYNETLQRKCYVVVQLKFKSNKKTYVFSRRYLPNIKQASFCKNMEKWLDDYTELKSKGKSKDGIKYPMFQEQYRVLFSLFDKIYANKDQLPEKVQKAIPIK